MKGTITIVGLGSGNEDSLSIGVYKILRESRLLFLRTKEHPVIPFLLNEKINYKTFDYLYDSMTEYDQVYKEIALFLIKLAINNQNVTYAVPGHPMVAEKSVKYLFELGNKENIKVEIVGGESFLDTFFSRLRIDPIDGFIFLNGEKFSKYDLIPSKNIIIGQVYNSYVASDVKLTLMEVYPEDKKIYIVSSLGINGEEVIKEVPIYQLDYNKLDFNHLSSIYVPKTEEEYYTRQFTGLVEIIKKLRSPDGCPWDKEQTHQSIRKNLIEETYELVETIDDLDIDHMVEELGDVLLQVLFHSQIADEEGYFDIFEVIENLNKKLIRRHPHVFGDMSAKFANDALDIWQKEKEKEKNLSNRTSLLDGIPRDLPVIYKAYKLQKKAAKVNFDWDNIDDVFSKVEEELIELKQAKKEEQLEEMGDVLFAVINLARFIGIDPEEALEKTNKKFIRRFNYIEERFKEQKIKFNEASLDIMEKYWVEAKKNGL